MKAIDKTPKILLNASITKRKYSLLNNYYKIIFNLTNNTCFAFKDTSPTNLTGLAIIYITSSLAGSSRNEKIPLLQEIK